MNKELEMLENISKEEIVVRDRSSVYMNPNDNGKGAFIHLTTVGVNFKGAIEILRQALQRLEAIENSNPSEALECLEEMAKYRIEYSEYSMPIKDISEYKTINKALLKSQEQEKQNATYKDLEKELGCPLDVFVKALTNGVYVIDEETKELQCILRGIYTFTGEGLGTNAGFSDERIWRKKLNKAGIEFYPIYFWKDYKKTWFLKEDRSE